MRKYIEISFLSILNVKLHWRIKASWRILKPNSQFLEDIKKNRREKFLQKVIVICFLYKI